jgi:hypothetical protein
MLLALEEAHARAVTAMRRAPKEPSPAPEPVVALPAELSTDADAADCEYQPDIISDIPFSVAGHAGVAGDRTQVHGLGLADSGAATNIMTYSFYSGIPEAQRTPLRPVATRVAGVGGTSSVRGEARLDVRVQAMVDGERMATTERLTFLVVQDLPAPFDVLFGVGVIHSLGSPIGRLYQRSVARRDVVMVDPNYTSRIYMRKEWRRRLKRYAAAVAIAPGAMMPFPPPGWQPEAEPDSDLDAVHAMTVGTATTTDATFAAMLSSDHFVEQRDSTVAMLRRYGHMFGPLQAGVAMSEPVRITMIGDPATLRRGGLTNIKPQHQEKFQAWLRSLLETDCLEPGRDGDRWNHVVVADKPPDDIRPCMDLRELNGLTAGGSFVMPDPDAIATRCRGCTVFSTLDAQKGFHQMPVAEEDRWLLGFKTQFGAFRWKRVPFGWTEAPRVFMARMSEILREAIDAGYVEIFMDDILVRSADAAEHARHLERVFALLSAANVRLSPRKCRLFRPVASYLGYLIDGVSKRIDPARLQGLRDFPQPTTRAQLVRFVAMVSYYRQFVRGLTELIGPLWDLNDAAQPHATLKWGPEHTAAFEATREAILTATALGHPMPGKPYLLRTDASDIGLGAVLLQEQEPGVWVPIAFISRKLTDAERNYSVTEREVLALFWAVTQKLHGLLTGATFVAELDHKNVLYGLDSVSPRVKRQMAALCNFSFQIRHIPGEDNVAADALSRAYALELTSLDAMQMLLPFTEPADVPAFVQRRSPRLLQRGLVGPATLGEAARAPKAHDAVTTSSPLPDTTPAVDAPPAAAGVGASAATEPQPDALSALLQPQLQELRIAQRDELHQPAAHGYTQRAIRGVRLWTCGGSVVIPPRQSALKSQALHLAHEVSGHGGVDTTLEHLQVAGVWWPGMTADVRQHVRTCIRCQCAKLPGTDSGYGHFHGVYTKAPYERLIMDVLGPMPVTAAGNKYILAVLDAFSRRTWLFALKDTTGGSVVACLESLLADAFIPPPKLIQSDGASYFRYGSVAEYLEKQGISHHVSTPYHPASNGIVERANSVILNALRVLDHHGVTDWDARLDLVQRRLNLGFNRTRGACPYEIITGHKPYSAVSGLGVSPDRQREYGSAEELAALVHEVQARVLLKLEQEYLRLAEGYNAGRLTSPFTRGSTVLVRYDSQANKLAPRWQGPFTVLKDLGRDKYRVQHMLDKRITSIAADRMRPIDTSRMDANDLLQFAHGEGWYSVEAITNHRGSGSQLQFEVKWRGYDEPTWEPVDHVRQTGACREYLKAHPSVKLPRGARAAK